MHAVFKNRQFRVSGWLAWGDAQDRWTTLQDDARERGVALRDEYYEVRSSDDPKYNALPFLDLSRTKLDHVKLSRTEREHLLTIGRRAGNRDDAAHAIADELLREPEWEHLEAVVISDYAWAAANFCFPREARYA